MQFKKYKIYLLNKPEIDIKGFKLKYESHKKYLLYLEPAKEVSKHYILLFTSKRPKEKHLNKYLIFNDLIKTKNTAISYLEKRMPYIVSEHNITKIKSFDQKKEIYISIDKSKFTKQRVILDAFLEKNKYLSREEKYLNNNELSNNDKKTR